MKRVLISLFLTLSLFSIPMLGENEPLKISPVPETFTPTPMSSAQYIFGGALGSLVGFGTGHAIQGRYKEKGWIFTLAESLAVGSIITGAVWTNNLSSKPNVGKAEALLPVIGFSAVGGAVGLAFHIWEIIDLWTVKHDG
jgi:hypothetical protein